MTYSKKQFGIELLKEIERNYDVVRLSRWAHSKFFENCRDLEEGLREIMMQIIAMEEGPEFEIPRDELRSLAISLTN